MKWANNRFLLMVYVACLAGLILVGCTSKEDPKEVLPLCNDHSCGELVMVTTDTSSDGFQYLNPVLSPDETRIAFTSDWWALPSDPRLTEEQPFTTNRQISIIPVQEGIEPVEDLEEQDARLMRLETIFAQIGGSTTPIQGLDDDKGEPMWVDDNTLVFWMKITRGNRLFRGDISNLSSVTPELLYLENQDSLPGGSIIQHMAPAVSPDDEWLVFTRSECVAPDDPTTCTGTQLLAMRLSAVTADPYATVVFPVTSEVSRIETPRWSPDGRKIIFSGGLDVGNSGTGSGTELFTVDFDTLGLADYVANGTEMQVDNNLVRLTYTEYSEGDPISGVLNYAPVYSPNMDTVYFVSTRRAPSITLHDRNVWRIPANGVLEPEIVFFSREDDTDCWISGTGQTMVLSSMMGFPSEMLDRLQAESYLRLQLENPTWSEIDLQDEALNERRQLEFFQGVMSHLFLFSNW